MKVMKSLFAATLVALSVWSASAAYKEIQCTTDPVFSSNSCNQCFEWGAKWEGANLGFLSDEWVNSSSTDKILYKEEQDMPKMVNLDPASVTWKSIPGEKGFWEYTNEFNALYKADEEWYVLPKWKRVKWLASKTAYAYNLQKNKAATGRNIGLLVYPLSIHNISDTGDISVDASTHRECVLFTSGSPKQKEVQNTGTPAKAQPAKPIPQTGPSWKMPTARNQGAKAQPAQHQAAAPHLPKTGPEHYVLLLILAMVLGFGIMRLRKNS